MFSIPIVIMEGKYWRTGNPIVSKFVRVIPKSYLKMRERISELENSGLEKFDAEMAAFEEGTKEEKRKY